MEGRCSNNLTRVFRVGFCPIATQRPDPPERTISWLAFPAPRLRDPGAPWHVDVSERRLPRRLTNSPSYDSQLLRVAGAAGWTLATIAVSAFWTATRTVHRRPVYVTSGATLHCVQEISVTASGPAVHRPNGVASLSLLRGHTRVADRCRQADPRSRCPAPLRNWQTQGPAF